MSLYAGFFDQPGQVVLKALMSGTNNAEKVKRLGLFQEFSKSFIDKDYSFILCGSSVWGPDDGGGKPVKESDIDVIALAKDLDFVNKLSHALVPPSQIVQQWKKGEITTVAVLGKLADTAIEFSVIQPEFFQLLCNGKANAQRNFRYREVRYKQGNQLYGIGFEHLYDFKLAVQPRKDGYLVTDPTSHIVAPDKRFMMGPTHTKILTGISFPDYFDVQAARKQLLRFIYSNYCAERKSYPCDLLHPFVWIRSHWDPAFEAVLAAELVNVKTAPR